MVKKKQKQLCSQEDHYQFFTSFNLSVLLKINCSLMETLVQNSGNVSTDVRMQVKAQNDLLRLGCVLGHITSLVPYRIILIQRKYSSPCTSIKYSKPSVFHIARCPSLSCIAKMHSERKYYFIGPIYLFNLASDLWHNAIMSKNMNMQAKKKSLLSVPCLAHLFPWKKSEKIPYPVNMST